jgi:hypothetical protein
MRIKWRLEIFTDLGACEYCLVLENTSLHAQLYGAGHPSRSQCSGEYCDNGTLYHRNQIQDYIMGRLN